MNGAISFFFKPYIAATGISPFLFKGAHCILHWQVFFIQVFAQRCILVNIS